MRFTNSLYIRLYPYRRPLAYLLYGLVSVLALVAGFLLRFEFRIPSHQLTVLLYTAPIVAAVRIGFAVLFKLSSGRWRFISTAETVRLVAATTTGTALLFAIRAFLLPQLGLSRAVLLIEWLLTTHFTATLWITYRIGYERFRRLRDRSAGPAKRVVIVGAGEAGNLLAREIQRFPTGYRLIGFVDDDPMKWGVRLQGVEVIGGTSDLTTILRATRAEEVILAIPSAEPKDLRRVVERCEAAQIPFKVLPGIAEVLEGKSGISHVRELRVEDLLGREPIDLALPALAEDLAGRCVLITGAAGSIGSELARQVALHNPGKLVLLDQAETDLFFLDLELRDTHPDLDLVPVVADVVDAPMMDRVFRDHVPDRVFHAAAYKHVPMLECNSEAAMKNNVLGTHRVAEAAGRHGVGKFVLVSTDKAVRPRNVMGATKRLAEMIILTMQREYAGTAYGAVRFGNVLGSNGSVIPVFRRQIAARRPLSVTHPDVTRYFMTIPEAVQLILKASLVPEFRGHIAMLEMGEPVRILDLARNLLRLSGVSSRAPRSIVYTGLRPGEKLHEELVAPDEETVQTQVPKVRLLRTSDGPGWDLHEIIQRWDHAFSNGSAGLPLQELVQMFEGVALSRVDGAGPDGRLAGVTAAVNGNGNGNGKRSGAGGASATHRSSS